MRTIFADEKERIEIKLTAFSSSLIFAFSLNQWGQTNMSEVYALNTFFIALLVLLILHWREGLIGRADCNGPVNARYIYLAAFLFGIGFGDHHTILVVVPVAFFMIAVTRWQVLFDHRKLILTLFFFLLGLSVYIYMPVRATAGLIMNWGDPETFTQFKWMFFREGYPKGQISRDWGLFWSQLKTINLLYEFTIMGFALALIGLMRYAGKGWIFTVNTFLVLMVLSVGIIVYSSAPPENIFLYESFHTPTYMMLTPWIGVGIFWLLSLAASFAGKFFEGESSVKYLVTVWLVVLVAIPSVVFASHYRKNDRSRNFISFDYAVNELKSLPAKAIFFTWGDSGAFPLWYLQYVERYQPGVLLLHTPHLGSDWYVNEIPDLKMSRIRRIPVNHRSPGVMVEVITKENLGVRKTYIDYSSKYSFPIRKMKFQPYGIVYEYVGGKKGIDESVWKRYVTRKLSGKGILKDLDISKALHIYGFCRYDTGAALLREGKRREAVRHFAEAVTIVPSLKRRVQNALFPGGRRPGR